jgi:hypothetical protein
MKIPQSHREKIFPLLAKINEKVLIGHFEICSEDGSVSYRHGQLLRSANAVSAELIAETLDFACAECERFYPAFQSLLWGGQQAEDALQLALWDPVGEA